jgi:putative transposase
MEGKTSFDQYRMPDELWQQLEPLLPEYNRSRVGGRPRTCLRRIADAIFYRFRTGCQWKAIPRELAAGSTAHQYFQDWVQRGIIALLWRVAIRYYRKRYGLRLRRQCIDAAITKAPLGGEKTGKNPTDRAKSGTKRSLITDANGVPIGVAVDAANVHDVKLVQQTIDNCLENLEQAKPQKGEQLCADQGYRGKAVQQLIESVYGYKLMIESRTDSKMRSIKRVRAFRWVIERTHSWLNRFRGILIRWEKKVENHFGALCLVRAYFTVKCAGVFG